MGLIEIIVGGFIAVIVLLFFRGLPKYPSKLFFARTLIVAAVIYVGFALYGLVVGTASFGWLLIEVFGVALYFAFAYGGIRKSAWILGLGWAAHVLWDTVLHSAATTQFVPPFYPAVCIGFDLVFAAYIFYRFYISYRE